MTNLRNVLHQSSLSAILAVGMSLVMISGGIDLSVGSLLALSSVTFGLAAAAGLSWPLAIALAVVLAAGTGCLNGALVGLARIPSFVATLGMMSAARGVALTISAGASIGLEAQSIRKLEELETWPVPLSVWVTISVVLAVAYMAKELAVGTHIYALGDDKVAAARAGIRVTRTTIAVFGLSGGLAGCAGVLTTIRLGASQPIFGFNSELDAIAAAVVGGVSLSGGRGSVVGAMLGALSIALLHNGLTLLNVDVYAQYIVVGVVLFVAHMLRWNKATQEDTV